MTALLRRVDKEIENVLAQPWTELKKQNYTFVARHTLMVLAISIHDPLYEEMTKIEQNALKWASLLHDLAKLSIPAIEGKDHVHPFKSAIYVLDLFEKLDYIPEITVEKK